MTILTLLPGPRLQTKRWSTTDRKNVTTDITGSAALYLNEYLELKDPTLQDLLELIRQNPVLQSIQTRNFIEEFLEEAAKGPLPQENDHPDNALEYLELYRLGDHNSRNNQLSWGIRWSLHAVGVERQTDDDPIYPKGHRTKWGISGSHLRSMLLLPIRICEDLVITEADTARSKYGSTSYTFKVRDITLMELIEGVMWELSFHGGPAKSSIFFEGLKRQVADIQASEGAEPETRITEDGETVRKGNLTSNEVFKSLHLRRMAHLCSNYTCKPSAFLKALRWAPDDADAQAILAEAVGADTFELHGHLKGKTCYELRVAQDENLEADED